MLITAMAIGMRYSYYMTGLIGITPHKSIYAEYDLQGYSHQGVVCRSCKAVVSALNLAIQNNGTTKHMTAAIKQGCAIGPMDSEFCSELFDGYAYPVFHNLITSSLDPDYIC